MAKFALVRYGSRGEGPSSNEEKTYTYIVNDNVRTGDNIQPVVKHAKTGKIFATTGLVKNAYKQTTAKGQEAKQEADERGRDVTRAYSGKELGIDVQKQLSSKTQKGYQTEYNKLTRGGNIAKYVQTHQTPMENIYKSGQETFEQYSKKYMGDKDNG